MSERAHGFESHPLRFNICCLHHWSNTDIALYKYNDRSVLFGEVPKLAEGTPLERVQVVNSGARVQIPPSPLDYNIEKDLKKSKKVVDK